MKFAARMIYHAAKITLQNAYDLTGSTDKKSRKPDGLRQRKDDVHIFYHGKNGSSIPYIYISVSLFYLSSV